MIVTYSDPIGCEPALKLILVCPFLKIVLVVLTKSPFSVPGVMAGVRLLGVQKSYTATLCICAKLFAEAKSKRNSIAFFIVVFDKISAWFRRFRRKPF